MSDVLVRPAQAADLPQIGFVGYASWVRGIGPHVGPEAHERISEDVFSSFARDCREQILVAELGGRVIGFVATEDGDDYISDLWVSPDSEGQGIGSRLISAVEAIVAARGYAFAEVEVLTANDRALRLYGHLGFETVSKGYQDDSVLGVKLHKTLLRKRITDVS